MDEIGKVISTLVLLIELGNTSIGKYIFEIGGSANEIGILTVNLLEREDLVKYDYFITQYGILESTLSSSLPIIVVSAIRTETKLPSTQTHTLTKGISF